MRIYLVYRPEDSADFSDRVTDHLMRRYGPESVVRNVIGRDLADYQRQVAGWLQQCQVVVVVIGPTWSTARDPWGTRLIDQPSDPIRIQIREALSQSKLLVPLIVNGATMPPVGSLPDDIAALSYRQAYAVRSDPDFNADMFGVYTQINVQLEWRPASLVTIAGAGVAVNGFCGILVGYNVGGGWFLGVMSAILGLTGFLVALTTGIVLSIRRRHWWWLGSFVVAALVSTLAFMIPNALLQYLVWFLGLVLAGLFGFIGPRRERAFIV